MSGWSAVGGLVRNPYALDRTACGSSSRIGRGGRGELRGGGGGDRDRRIGRLSVVDQRAGRAEAVDRAGQPHACRADQPFSQDTPGPMARSVRDVATLLSAMVAADPADAATAGAKYARDYAAGLSTSALSGVRIGVVRPGDARRPCARLRGGARRAEGGGRGAGRGRSSRSSTGSARRSCWCSRPS